MNNGNAPDFLIIGAQKSATSTLHSYLSQHPKIVGSKPKEIHYFDWEIYFDKDRVWYESHFQSVEKGKKFFEATPNYIYHEKVAQLIKSFYPEIKLILILRDPVSRAFSAWNFYRYFFESGQVEMFRLRRWPNGRENEIYQYLFKDRTKFPSFSEYIEIELELIRTGESDEPSVLRRGLYYDQITTYLKYFNKNQLHILGFKSFVTNPKIELNKILDFVGIERDDWFFLKEGIKNSRPYQHYSLSQEESQFLQDFYREPNEKLFDLIGPINW